MVFVEAGANQLLEVVTYSEMQSRPDIPAYLAEGISPVVGVPHICFRVADLPAWEERFRSLGYAINHKSPEQGYVRLALGSGRYISITGPSGVDIEFVEFEEEYPIAELPSQ